MGGEGSFPRLLLGLAGVTEKIFQPCLIAGLLEVDAIVGHVGGKLAGFRVHQSLGNIYQPDLFFFTQLSQGLVVIGDILVGHIVGLALGFADL